MVAEINKILDDAVEREITRWKRRLLVNSDGEWQRYSEWENSNVTRPDTLPKRQYLLREVAAKLWSEARACVPRVLENQADGVPHPIDKFIRAQTVTDSTQFQLPEPLLGPVGDATPVLVIGLNPGYGPDEDIPTLDSTLNDYVVWYSTRMSPQRRDWAHRPASDFRGKRGVIRHYAAVERDYLDVVCGPQALGRVALYADAIPWKWNADFNPDLRNTAILKYARARIAQIAAVLQPRVLMTLGVFAADALGLQRPADRPEIIHGWVGYWQGQCLPLFHPNKRWPTGARHVYLELAQQQLRRVVLDHLQE